MILPLIMAFAAMDVGGGGETYTSPWIFGKYQNQYICQILIPTN
jgi:hypothetical protein